MRHDTRKKRALSGPFRDCLLHALERAPSMPCSTFAAPDFRSF
jgi:hypothetical protein